MMGKDISNVQIGRLDAELAQLEGKARVWNESVYIERVGKRVMAHLQPLAFFTPYNIKSMMDYD